jgi:outer membrane protein assembly factor BamB
MVRSHPPRRGPCERADLVNACGRSLSSRVPGSVEPTYDTSLVRSNPSADDELIWTRRRVIRAVTLLLTLSACSVGRQGYRVSEGESYSPLGPASAPVDAAKAWTADWSMDQFDLAHGSRNHEADAITADNAAELTPVWQWFPDPSEEDGQPAALLLASPTVSGGRIYIGANSGVFYAIDATNGTIVWQRQLGYVAEASCPGQGITSTAALANDGDGQLVVFVGAGDGSLYALRAEDGSVIWKVSVVGPRRDETEGSTWSSPAVADGHVFVGVSSPCESAQIRGGLKAFDQTSGKRDGAYWVVPKNAVGGSVRSSPMLSGDDVFVSTGNADPTGESPEGDSSSLVQLDGSSLEKLTSSTVPDLLDTDRAFDASPSWFAPTGNASAMVGACNTNGLFYAFHEDALQEGPVWEARISVERSFGGNCLGGAVWDPIGSRVIVTGGLTTIDGEVFQGSVQALDARTGRPLWQRGTPLPIWGGASLNGSGILAAPAFGSEETSGNGVYLLDAERGAILTRLDTGGSPVSAQPVFSDRYLFVATQSEGLIAFAAPPSEET